MRGRSRVSRHTRESWMRDRKRSKDRRRNRRQNAERRAANSEWHGPERRVNERRAVERRFEPADSYSREEEDRIRHVLKDPNGRKLLAAAIGIRCPRCEGRLKLKPPMKWQGGVTVLEVRCTECPRSLIVNDSKPASSTESNSWFARTFRKST